MSLRLTAALAATAICLAAPASAGLVAEYSIDGGGSFVPICSDVSGGSCGSSFSTANNLNFTLFGATSNSPGTAADANLFQATVRVTNTGGTAESIILRAGDVGYTEPTAPPNASLNFINSIAGTVVTGGAGNLFASDACVNPSNAQNSCAGGTLTPLINANITAPGAGSNSSQIAIASLVGPFSMTELLNITLDAGAEINFSASADVVPAGEPMGLAVLGVGLLGLGLTRVRYTRS